ncbi:cobalt-precorrin-6A reductase [Mumia sp. DW29H23]|uniref:cobalt-precorrin-6A reductase n=1 Tax=Mumia sp. DW29H23 TaxID=3421241 RepID=UPI003D69D724
MSVLVLGGTAEARELAALLDADGTAVVSSLAGRVARPRLPVGEVRVGGFGGVDGLRRYLRDRGVGAVVDATHPFAEGISANAAAACAADAVPLLRLERPGWAEAPGADRWIWVDDHDAAARATAERGVRPFLTVGRQRLDRFVGPLRDHRALVRVVDPPEIALPDAWEVRLDRGPYDLDGERALLGDRGIDVLVTKDSGGRYTWPKMAAADELGIAVVVVRRRSASCDVTTVGDAHAAAAWVGERLDQRD